MKTSIKVRDLTLKNIFIILSYTALLVLGVIYFESIFQYLGELLNIIQPFIIGFILAFIFNIPMKFFEKKLAKQNKKKRRVVSAILSVLLILLVLLLVVMVVVPQVIENVRTLIDNLPSIFAQAEKWLNYVFEEIRLSPDLLDKINEFQTRFAQTFISTLTAWAPNIASGVSHITTSVINIFMGFVMAIYMIFSKDKLIRQVKKFAHALFNDQHYQYISEVVKLTGTTFENFLAGQLTESIIIGVLCYIGCMILDIPYASIAAIVIGFTNIIPYFGPYIGAIPIVIVGFMMDPVVGICCVISIVVVQLLENNFYQPLIMGHTMKLHPVTIMIGLLIFQHFFGIIGMIVATPVIAALKIILTFINEKIDVYGKVIGEEEKELEVSKT